MSKQPEKQKEWRSHKEGENMGQAKCRAVEIVALKALPSRARLHSMNVFYKCNEPSGFSLTIN
jgi:hypothetical protein